FLAEIIEGLFKTTKKIGLYIPGHVDEDMKNLLRTDHGTYSLYMPGQLNYKEHVAIVKACSFGITPAVMENFSMAILEATYSGVPVLAFRRGGNEDIIVNGKNGYLFPAFEVEKMIAAARALIRNGQIGRLKARARKFTRAKFNSKIILNRYVQVLGLS
ncbi:MAG TPA: glycosyltransferase family 4 protein, partial [Terriglobales bacterium]|nr:glycosyltransferase family 4 protein [Terriglobales bacterium]